MHESIDRAPPGKAVRATGKVIAMLVPPRIWPFIRPQEFVAPEQQVAGERDDWYRLARAASGRSEEHTSELQSLVHLVCRLLLEKTKVEARAGSPFDRSS